MCENDHQNEPFSFLSFSLHRLNTEIIFWDDFFFTIGVMQSFLWLVFDVFMCFLQNEISVTEIFQTINHVVLNFYAY